VSRVFFIGAGASAADGFPVTRDLMSALAYAVDRYDPEDSHTHRLYEYLHTVYGVSGRAIRSAAAAWLAFLGKRGRIAAQPSLPSIIEMLSVLDIVCQEGLSLGPAAGRRRARSAHRNLDSLELRRVRDRVQQALIEQFTALQRRRRPSTFEAFVRTLGPTDVVITTNWDLLLDRALDKRFGPPRDASAFGAPQAGLERARSGGGQRSRPRPLLLKLHGSLNWLWCTQCGGMTIDLRRRRPAGREAVHDDPYGFRCPCGGQFTGLIVTPTFLKRYENHHIGAVWNRALASLIQAPAWTFIGYSLPEDDVAIRALLLKALVAHRRATRERRRGAKPTRVRLVMRSDAGAHDPAVFDRYRLLCGDALQPADCFWHGFQAWTRQLAHPRGRAS
jgi:NAD-dependent SIR2 family protein deacetylase